ncbi:unnamed protein product [Spirodela intermedia]|uniref:DUF642 domain-containing protein n=1 Tax=Spirodela intermedia TaxID=51605 RepID=A0ABN7EBD9_SPIIN|nr:unnamed protein product [Spirodela intermedia]
MLLVRAEGAFAVRLGNEASIRQKRRTSGMYYAITFSAARTCAQEEKPERHGGSGLRAPHPSSSLSSTTPALRKTPPCGPLIDSIAIKELYPPALTTNLLKNGISRKAPTSSPTTTTVLFPYGWVESLKAVKYIDAAHFSVPQGQRAVELVAGRGSALRRWSAPCLASSTPSASPSATPATPARGRWWEPRRRGYRQGPLPVKGKGGFKKAVLRFTAAEHRTRVMFFSTFYHTRSDDLSSLLRPGGRRRAAAQRPLPPRRVGGGGRLSESCPFLYICLSWDWFRGRRRMAGGVSPFEKDKRVKDLYFVFSESKISALLGP